MLWNIANILTLFRILLIPAIVGVFYTDAPLNYLAAAILFIIACITDYFDGFVARLTKKVTTLGRFLDPLADKLLIAATIIMLVGFNRIQGLTLIPTVIIICREILVSGLREYLSALQLTLPVTPLAKWKTAVQMFGLGSLIIGDTLPMLPLETAGLSSLWIAAALTVITGYDYLKSSLLHMK